jgi:hypothetical protein
MLVATFGATTAWAGKTITWDGDRFILEGYGRIPGAALVDYDQQGHLQWASAELRSWAWAYAHWEASGAAPAQAATRTQAVAQPLTTAQPWAAAHPYAAAQPYAAARPATKKPFPVWAIILIVAAALLLVAGPIAAIVIPMVLVQDQHSKESAVREGTHSLQVGIQQWAIDHENQYPAAPDMNQGAMAPYIDVWPTNPYTGAPMAEGTSPGDFSYELSPDGRSFRLVGYGEDGKIVIDLSTGGATI